MEEGEGTFSKNVCLSGMMRENVQLNVMTSEGTVRHKRFVMKNSEALDFMINYLKPIFF